MEKNTLANSNDMRIEVWQNEFSNSMIKFLCVKFTTELSNR